MVRVEPPKMDYFDKERPALGDQSFAFQFGPLVFQINGLTPDHVELLEARYGPYAADMSKAEDPISVQAHRGEGEYFIQPPATFEFVQVHLAFEPDLARYLSYRLAGWFSVKKRRGEFVLSSGEWEPFERSIENYIRSLVAWRAISLGGALVHAASAVYKGKGYLFFGESGAGKSTLSECNRRGRVVSDDLSLVLNKNGRLHLIGSAFRGTYEGGEPVVGEFPLVAGFRIIQAQGEVKIVDVPRPVVFGGLVGNLPFVAEAFPDRPDLFADVENSFRGIPLGHLHFKKDDTYWDVIDAAGY